MKKKWTEIKANLKKMLDLGIFKVWVEPVEAEVNADNLHLYAPNAFMADWLKRHLLLSLREAASKALGVAPEEVQVEISVAENRAKIAKKPVTSAELLAGMGISRQQGELPVKAVKPASGQCLWRYKFDDFVIGTSNNLAVAAARDICQSGQVHTLFVTSGPGLGKTHLAQAVGQQISQARQPLKVAYLTAEQFASRYVAAMRAKDLEDFKQYLCGLDCLLLEDVHFLQRKKAMQEMILTVIKNLQEKGGRVIFTSSFSPRQLQEIDSQLVSHFCSGILTNMEKPDMDMRKEILKRKAKSFQVALPDEICDLLSQRLSTDVRQLESCLKSMVFKARLLNSGLSLDLAYDTLSQYAGVENILDLSGIVRLVCESFGLTETQLRSRSRKQEYVQGRNTVFYLARKHTESSLEEIGNVLNRRHSTVLRSITQVEEELGRESKVGRQIARVVSLIERKAGIN